MAKSLHCIVSGKVQGVFFRSWIFDQANNLGLTGWVRNIGDGKVEVLAQGSEENMQILKDHLVQGSPLSRVDNVEANWTDYEKEYSDFQIRG